MKYSKDLALVIVKGTLADFALNTASLHALTPDDLSKVLIELAEDFKNK